MKSIFWGKNFFEKPTFASHFLKSIFSFWREDFWKVYFIKSLFQIDFLGKKIYDKLFALYRQKTPGTGRGGGSGSGMGEYLGAYARIKMKKPPESVATCSEGTSLLHSSAVIAPNHPAFPASLASSQGYFSGSYSGLSPSPSAQFHISSYAFSSGCSLSLGTS